MRPIETIFHKGSPGRRGVRFAEVAAARLVDEIIPSELLRERRARLPEVSEPDVVRHYTGLSRLNVGVDTTFYPLGSCTMKYNPRENEAAAALEGFAGLHPLQADDDTQGALALMAQLEAYLCEITGLSACSLVPTAGAQGEFTGVRMIAAYHAAQGDDERDILVIPDSAHGTNPASAAMCGFQPVEIASRPDGRVDLEALGPYLNERLAGVMLTNPNTLGLFERDILEISERVHSVGGLLYYDGANLNAIVGRYRPGEMGFNVVHLNTHKTFSTPHGGGGPGSGPVVACERLAPFLPIPRIVKEESAASAEKGEPTTTYRLSEDFPQSIGRLHAFSGNVGVAIRAYNYILRHGAGGLRQVAEDAVLSANYLKALLAERYEAPYDGPCMHEFVLSLRRELKNHGVRALDVAKRLLDFGFHAPTVYFPLLVKEGMLVEPTETESKQTLDAFAESMNAIYEEIETDPERLAAAPLHTPRRRLDDVLAARKPVLNHYSE